MIWTTWTRCRASSSLTGPHCPARPLRPRALLPRRSGEQPRSESSASTRGGGLKCDNWYSATENPRTRRTENGLPSRRLTARCQFNRRGRRGSRRKSSTCHCEPSAAIINHNLKGPNPPERRTAPVGWAAPTNLLHPQISPIYADSPGKKDCTACRPLVFLPASQLGAGSER